MPPPHERNGLIVDKDPHLHGKLRILFREATSSDAVSKALPTGVGGEPGAGGEATRCLHSGAECGEEEGPLLRGWIVWFWGLRAVHVPHPKLLSC